MLFINWCWLCMVMLCVQNTEQNISLSSSSKVENLSKMISTLKSCENDYSGNVPNIGRPMQDRYLMVSTVAWECSVLEPYILATIVTCDERWICQWYSEIEQKSMQWKYHGSFTLKKFQTSPLAGKIMGMFMPLHLGIWWSPSRKCDVTRDICHKWLWLWIIKPTTLQSRPDHQRLFSIMIPEDTVTWTFIFKQQGS
jgi:hypothetical protein